MFQNLICTLKDSFVSLGYFVKNHTMKRKIFSEVQKRIIAYHQGYRCTGLLCKKHKLLPQTWELDHVTPLHQGGSNFYDFTNRHHPCNNLQVICPSCHSLKTQHEMMGFELYSKYFIK